MVAALLGAVCLASAGCGSVSAPARVQVSLTAPTDGATVAVSRIEVLGTISPPTAELSVLGRPVAVTRGTFKTPISLHKGLTRIKITARAKGLLGSSMVVSVRYVPSSSAPNPQGGGADAGQLPRSGLPPAAEAEAIGNCSVTSGGQVELCTCIFDRLAKAGFNTEAKWNALVYQWRRSLLSKGQITFPRVMLRAASTCAREYAGR